MNRFLLMIVISLNALYAYSTDYVYKAGYGIASTWRTEDAIGIFPVQSSETYFGINSVNSTDSHLATCYGYGVGLTSGKKYYALSPFVDSYYMNGNVSTALPLSYPTLKQSKNNDMTHIAKSDYMIADVTASSSTTFSFDHLGYMLRLSVKTQDAETFTGAELQTSKGAFMNKGTLNIEERRLTVEESSSVVGLTLDNIYVSRGGQLTVYFVLPATDMSSGKITATFKTASGNTYTCSFDGKKYEAGKLYNVERTLSQGGTYRMVQTFQQSQELTTRQSKQRKASASVTYSNCQIKDFILASNDISYYIIGDANSDGKVSISDIVTTVKYINGITPTKFNKDAVDFNKDGIVNKTDLPKLENLILSK